MMKSVENIEGYVIRLSNCGEQDAMVTALAPGGLCSFLARGVRKVTSKNAAATGILAHSRFSLTEGKGGSYALKESELIAPAPFKDDLTLMAALSYISELCSKLIQEEEAELDYPWLSSAMEAIREGFSPLTSALILEAHILENMGNGLEVDACVGCGEKKRIVGVSYADGGFVCDNCFDETSIRATPRKLKIIRYAFKCGPEDLSRVAFGDDECKDILGDLAQYVEDYVGVTFRSLPVLLRS